MEDDYRITLRHRGSGTLRRVTARGITSHHALAVALKDAGPGWELVSIRLPEYA